MISHTNVYMYSIFTSSTMSYRRSQMQIKSNYSTCGWPLQTSDGWTNWLSCMSVFAAKDDLWTIRSLFMDRNVLWSYVHHDCLIVKDINFPRTEKSFRKLLTRLCLMRSLAKLKEGLAVSCSVFSSAWEKHSKPKVLRTN